MRKHWGRFVNIILILLVAFSLLATFAIFSPTFRVFNAFPGFGQNKDQDQQQVATGTLNVTQPSSAPLQVVFSPKSVVRHTKEEGYVKSFNPALIKQLTQPLFDLSKTIDAGKIKEEESEDLRQAIDKKDFVEFEFSDEIPMAFLLKGAPELDKSHRDYVFDRIIMTVDDPKIYLLSEKNDKAFTVEAQEEGPIQTIQDQLNQDKSTFYAVQPFECREGRIYLSKEAQELDILTYMVERQPINFYLNKLFPSPENIHDYSDANYSRYFSDGKSLLLDNNTLELVYASDGSDGEALQQDEAIQESFNLLKDFQPAYDSWKFTDFSGQNQQIVFRKFIAGLPVFGPHNVSKIKLKISDQGLLGLNLSALTIQTPVTPLSAPVRLMSGKDVVRILAENNYSTQEIDMIQLGYRWVRSDKSNALVELVPSWHVKLKGRWHMLDNLVDMSKYKDLQTIHLDTKENINMQGLTDHKDRETGEESEDISLDQEQED
ncbi:YycH family regulatory protein [Aerococcus sp. HMSC23C02]|uniref:YycH family regulatory protein n=1 Tax=Aerococcus sp. HMSC23C02 TaxID=1581058 RepID=UPI0008A24045|nr:two-component system activity regulator YycH [Aerococcus sp. HMSC23C02]OFT92856.1 hypothetical protein HMPREF3090_07885 [Aerococcus sp. HMSC23C02]